jgi:spore germination cell wall hydrolase CwlJ-like protein
MQFSSWNADDPNRAKLLAVTTADPQFAKASAIAAEAVQGSLIDITDGADHYYATSISTPAWAQGKAPTCTIGRQVFYALGPTA